jgi:hypothetical protein
MAGDSAGDRAFLEAQLERFMEHALAAIEAGRSGWWIAGADAIICDALMGGVIGDSEAEQIAAAWVDRFVARKTALASPQTALRNLWCHDAAGMLLPRARRIELIREIGSRWPQ